MIEAIFTAGGLTTRKPCVYVIEIACSNMTWVYVGRTRTSNKTGMSPPYKRLALHLAKRGKTQSCIWSNHPKPLSRRALREARITFRAVFVPGKSVQKAEKWLRWYLQRKCRRTLLNREPVPRREPCLEEDIKESLRPLLAARRHIG